VVMNLVERNKVMDLAGANTDHKIIQTRLASLFSETLHLDVPSVDTDLFDTGLLDSQRFVELLLHIEQKFNTHIDIADFEIENFRCIEKIAALILQQTNGNAAAQHSDAGA
jgi:methoxymalonate biosynthesis acyl carrier protein